MNSSAGEADPEQVAAEAEALAEETVGTARRLAAETARTADALAIQAAAKALELTGELAGTLEKISERLEQYSVYGRRSRKIIIALAVSFCLDICITLALGFTAVKAHDTAGAVHEANITSCHNGNSFRGGQTTIWRDFVSLAVKPAPGETEAQIAKSNLLASAFMADVERVNHPVNCQALYGG